MLKQIAAGEPRSRASVAAETGLTRGTVSSLVGELIELDLLRETGEDEHPGRVGRPAQTLELGDRVVAIGLEVNVDYLAVCVEDLTGDDSLRAARPHRQPALVAAARARPARRGWRREALDAVAGDAACSPPASRSRCPASSRRRPGTLLWAPNLGWSEISRRRRDRRTAAGPSDASAPRTRRTSRRSPSTGRASRATLENFVCVFGEVGVGGGIFIDGELFRGAHGFGGEFGHITVDPDGPPCKCGAAGCLETFVGQEAIARRAGRRRSASGGRTRSLTEELVRRAEHGDEAVLESLAEAGRHLGLGLASAVNLFDVDVVVLGGCFGPLAPWLVDDVRQRLASACSRPPGRAARCARRSSAREPPCAAPPR